jgi:hypothetical protein
MQGKEPSLTLCTINKYYFIFSFGHKNNINEIDAIGQDDFISCGYDRQAIYWKVRDF